MFPSKHKIHVVCSVMLVIFSGTCAALGVSDIQLNSYLNQKLDAEIKLNAASEDELGNLNVTIISDGGWNGTISQQLKHELIRTSAGGFLKITSDAVIKEPVLIFQLDLDWKSGQLLRDYTLLIDPPGAM